MISPVQGAIANLRSQDLTIQYQAFLEIQALTNEKVDWAYEFRYRETFSAVLMENRLSRQRSERNAVEWACRTI